MLTKNEEENIRKCLNSVKWADEVIILDDYSTDNTREIARKAGAKVLKRKLDNDFAAQRNFGLSKAKHEWVLFVDADEVVSPRLKKEIQAPLSGALQGYLIKRIDFIWSRKLKHGETGNIKLLRLAKKNAGKWKRSVHETWILRQAQGEIGEMENPIYHYPHKNVSEFLEKYSFG